MILERAIFAIKPGTTKEFEAAFAKARPHIEAARGFRKLEMCRGIENPDSFLLIVWWDRLEDHMKGFRESEAFVEWRRHLGPFFAAPPAVEHYEETL